jgi:transketolase
MAAQNETIESMKTILRRARLRLLQMHYESGVGHIGGNLSSLDLMLTLYHRVAQNNDHFILSKGHSAGALYTTLWSLGRLSDDDLKSFHKEDTLLSGHPPPKGIADILFATGSLGHGLGLAAGVALGNRLLGETGRVFCLMSDGEWNEGSNWESLAFAAHQKLENLTIIIDLNGLQGFGSTQEVNDISPLADKLARFGLNVSTIDGHDPEAIERALFARADGKPTAVVAKTVKGHGISFMENKMEWHYLPMSANQYAQAMEEVGRL